MLFHRQKISTVCLIILYTGVCSTKESVIVLDLKDGCNLEKRLFITFEYICNNWFTQAKLIVLIHTNNIKMNYFASRLHALAESQVISLLTVNINTTNLYSHQNSKFHATQEDVIVCFLEKRNNLVYILETNHVFHFNKESRVLVIYIQKSTTVAKQISEQILLPPSGKEVLMFAVVHVRVNMDSKGNQCEYDISVVSYNPFLEKYYSRRLTFETFSRAEEILRYAYSRSKVSNLQGHSLRVATHCIDLLPVFALNKIEGNGSTHGYLRIGLEEINKRMNYTEEYVVVYGQINFGNKFPNGTWSGIIGYLVTKRIDIAYTPLLERYERSQDVEFSEHITITQFSNVVPKAKQIPPWMLLVLIFEFNIVLYIFGSLVLMVVAYKLIYTFLNIYQDWNLIALEIFGILIGASFTEPTQHLVRTLYITWVYFSFVISSIYSQCIVSILTIPQYCPAINTFEELVDSKVPLKGWVYIQSGFEDKSNPLMWSLYERYKIVLNFPEVLRDIKEGKQVAAIHTKNTLDYSVDKARTCPICTDPFHYISELFGLQIQALPLAKGSPYVRRIDELITGIRESGLFDKWNSDVFYEIKLQTACFSACSVNKVLSVWDLQICFYILLAGTFVSLVLLYIEISYNSFCLCKKGRTIIKKRVI